MRPLTTTILLALAALLAGCNWLAFPLYVLAPDIPTKDEEAEFDGLVGKSVAIVIYANMDTLYEYPFCREELSTAVGKQLTDNVSKVSVVDPDQVVAFQEGSPHWDSMAMVDVGRRLEADYVLYISLSEFSTREEGSVSLPLGRITAAASVWDIAAEADDGEACVWRKPDLSIRQEAATGLLARDPGALRVVMQYSFAVQLGKFFYDHEAPIE